LSITFSVGGGRRGIVYWEVERIKARVKEYGWLLEKKAVGKLHRLGRSPFSNQAQAALFDWMEVKF
jgi:hypothetical protein